MQLMAAGGAAWIENWFRPTVVAAMLTCIVVAFVGLASRIVPSWSGLRYVVFVFLVSWVGIQSERLLRGRVSDYPVFRYRAVEVVLILVLFKLVRYIPLGWDALWADVRLWAADVGMFLNGGFIYGGMAVLALWLAAVTVTKSLYLLEVHPGEIPPDPTSPDYDRWSSAYGQRIDRQAVLKSIVGAYFHGGVVLLIITGLARFDIPTLYRYRPPPLSGLVANVMLYFVLGLALISQAHFSILQVTWRTGRINVSPGLGTRWAWQTIAFLALLMVMALILPTGYAVGLPQAISSLVMVIISVLHFLSSFLVYLILLPLSLLLQALGLEGEPVYRQRPTLRLSPVQPGDPGAAANLPWFELLKSVLFWGIFLAILAYSVYHFFRERPGLFPGLKGGLLARLMAWLRALWQGTRGWSARARRTIAARLRRRPRLKEPLDLWRMVRLSRLSPRQRVRYFYLSILRRAARAGHARRPQQTPFEYGTTLVEQIPEVALDVTALTQAFVEARYSQRSIDEQESSVIKRVWQRIRATLTRRRRSRESDQNAQEASHELAG